MRRNRILLGFSLLISLGTAVLLVPSLLVDSAANRFEVLKDIAEPLHLVVALVTAGLGLFILWSHRRARSIKMIATGPSPFGAWVASIFVSVAIVAALAHAGIALIVALLSWYWAIPYQSGFVFLPLVCFVDSMIGLAAFTFLSAVIHPVLAVILVAIAGEQTTMNLWQLAERGNGAGHPGAVLRGAGAVARTLYYLTPTFWPYGDRITIVGSMRVPASDWRHLEVATLYALLVCAFSLVATTGVLRGRQLT
jgi:hypothetical protein